jgi:hypothetical protein
VRIPRSSEDRICTTCDGERVLIGDAVDSRGERVDEVIDCPDCAVEDFRELDDIDDEKAPLEKSFWQSLALLGTTGKP